MKIYDCFPLFNELDLLEFRMTYLYSYVDYFVIAEADYTHSGITKPYNFHENKSRFNKFKDKIIYYPVKLDPSQLEFKKVDNYTPTDGAWIMENMQRNALWYIKEDISDDDMVLIGDLDEIPNAEQLSTYRILSHPPRVPKSLVQLFHSYFMNCQNIGYDRLWNGTVMTDGKTFKNSCPQVYRDNRNYFDRLNQGGWHFSYLGDVEKIKYKIESFAHTEFNRPEINNVENISRSLKEGLDIFDRPGVSFQFVDMETSQDYTRPLKNLISQYPQFVYDPSHVS